jgi:hypothetical protein
MTSIINAANTTPPTALPTSAALHAAKEKETDLWHQYHTRAKKADNYLVSAAETLKEIRKLWDEHPDIRRESGCRTFKFYVEKRAQISKSQAYRLLAIACGRETVEGMRAKDAASKKVARQRTAKSPGRRGQNSSMENKPWPQKPVQDADIPDDSIHNKPGSQGNSPRDGSDGSETIRRWASDDDPNTIAASAAPEAASTVLDRMRSPSLDIEHVRAAIDGLLEATDDEQRQAVIEQLIDHIDGWRPGGIPGFARRNQSGATAPDNTLN